MYERLADVRVEIGNLLKRVNLGFFKHNSTGELVSAVTTDMSFLEFSCVGAGKVLRINRKEFLQWLKEYQEGAG